MRTYSLITKPYRIRLKKGYKHTLQNPITMKFIPFESGVEFWCAQAYSEDHADHKSLLIFNHSFLSTFSVNSKKMPEKWEVIDTDKNWRDEMSVLQTLLTSFNCFTHGEVPDFAK
jgi:hypothetical protein